MTPALVLARVMLERQDMTIGELYEKRPAKFRIGSSRFNRGLTKPKGERPYWYKAYLTDAPWRVAIRPQPNGSGPFFVSFVLLSGRNTNSIRRGLTDWVDGDEKVGDVIKKLSNLISDTPKISGTTVVSGITLEPNDVKMGTKHA